MVLRIFDTDPEAAEKAKNRTTFDDGTIGRLHSGKQDENGDAVSLDHWEVSTGDISTSEGLAEFFGTVVIDTRSQQENFLRVETPTDTLKVVLSGPSALTSDLKLWANKQLFHHCDGEFHLSPQDIAGTPCGCPRLFSERKALSRVGRGPKPDIKLIVSLAGAEDLGTFAFRSGSWSMAEDLWKYEDALSQVTGPAVADLVLEEVDYTTKKGMHVNYRKPVLRNIRSYDDANAE